jgi:hypothetical protein
MEAVLWLARALANEVKVAFLREGEVVAVAAMLANARRLWGSLPL